MGAAPVGFTAISIILLIYDLCPNCKWGTTGVTPVIWTSHKVVIGKVQSGRCELDRPSRRAYSYQPKSCGAVNIATVDNDDRLMHENQSHL